jgi:predicted anti-sigma-YlaC factor YlaD
MDELFQKLKWLLILWLARRLPDCKRMTRTLGESLDRKATWREQIVMKLHLFTCEACERYLEQVAFLKKAAHAHGEAADVSEFTAASLTAESKERMKAFLRGNIGLAF